MDGTDWVLLLLLVLALAATLIHLAYPTQKRIEGFQALGAVPETALTNLTTQALDSAPSTSEVKQHYKNLLIFADNDIRKQGTAGLRILADFRDRVYGPRNFRTNLAVDDFIGDWPAWLPPMDPTQNEAIPSQDEAVTAELRMLAYLQKNYPQEPNLDEQTGSTVRNLVEDFGYRFVFNRGEETVQLRPDFLSQPLLKNWTNPVGVR
jgi:hypothetical protein